MYLSILILIEIFILSLGGILYNFRLGEKISESIAKGLFFSILLLSFSFQFSFLLNQPKISFLFESLFIIWSSYIIYKKQAFIPVILLRLKQFFVEYKFILSIVTITWIYLFALAVILPPSNWDSMTYNLARVLLFQQEKSIFLTNYSLESQVVFPVGADILHHGFLRFYTDYAIGIFSFIAYLIICFGTYALSRRYGDQKISLTATLIIASLPELVLQSTSTKNDIWTAAVAVISFILAHRLLTQINVEDLILLPITLAFGLSSKATFIAFLLPFTILFLILFFYKYKWAYLVNIISKYRLYFLVSILPLIIFIPIFNFYHNYTLFGNWNGSDLFVNQHKQIHGIIGTLGNAVRYLFQSIDVTEPIELLSKSITGKMFGGDGYTITELVVNLYNQLFHPIFRDKGIMESEIFPIINNNQGYPFFIIRQMGEDYSWFGFFAFILIIPSIIFALLKGDLYLKFLSVTLIIYVFFICNQIAWQPFINRFFTLFFANTGVLVAYFLSNIKWQKYLLSSFIFLSVSLLIYGVTFNIGKPLLKNPHEQTVLSDFNPSNWMDAVREKSIWHHAQLGQNRKVYFNNYPSTEIINKLIPPNSKVALITNHDTWIYQYLLYNPQITIIPFNETNQQIWDKILEDKEIKYIFCLNIECNPSNIYYNKNYQVLCNSSENIKGIMWKIVN